MSYQRLLAEAAPELDLCDFPSESDSETEYKPIRSQIRDLREMLEQGNSVYQQEGRIYIRYQGVVTFQIVMNRPFVLESLANSRSDTPDTCCDNRIYLEGIAEFPVYSEDVTSNPARNQLSNFWFSFVEHGLGDVLRLHQIKTPPERSPTPDILTDSV